MTDSYAAAPAPAPVYAGRRPFDVLGLISVIVAAALLLPALGVFLIGLIPSMNAIWWLGLVLIPLTGMAGVLALILGVVGIIVAVRRRGRFVLSVIGVVLGLVALLPGAYVYLLSSSFG